VADRHQDRLVSRQFRAGDLVRLSTVYNIVPYGVNVWRNGGVVDEGSYIQNTIVGNVTERDVALVLSVISDQASPREVKLVLSNRAVGWTKARYLTLVSPIEECQKL